MEVETVLLLVRQASCATIFWLLMFTYRPSDYSKWKSLVSLAASCVAGLALALMTYTAYFWHKEMHAWYLPWLTLIVFASAIRLYQTRGNMARALQIRKVKYDDTN